MNTWETEKVFESGDAYFESLLRGINSAVRTVSLETYIFSSDPLGDKVIAALVGASKRGVQTRILLDGIGSMDWPDRYWWELKSAGVEVRIFRPVPWSFAWLARLGRLQFGTVMRLIGRLNARNHRKTCVIDSRQAWLGSMNISGCHVSEVAGKMAWRDTGVAVSGAAVHELGFAFEEAWYDLTVWSLTSLKRIPARLRRSMIPRHPDVLLRLNFRRRLRRYYYRDILTRIRLAQKRVYLTTPYFVPDMRLLRTIARTARRGVDVRLLVPQKSDVWIVRYATMAYYRTLLGSGVKVYEYLPRILHAKIAMIDDWVSIGSSNWNSRSLIHDLEVDAMITFAENKELILSSFYKDLTESEQITIEKWRLLPKFRRRFFRAVLWVRYWL